MIAFILVAWTSLAVYKDGTVSTHEDMKSESLCREVLCSIQWRRSCDEHKADEASYAEQMKRYMAHRADMQKDFRNKHPCTVEPAARLFKNNPPNKKQRVCKMMDGSVEISDLDGSSTVTRFNGWDFDGSMTHQDRYTGPDIPYETPIARAVCFEEKK